MFTGIGQLPGTVAMTLQAGAAPSIAAPRKFPLAIIEKVKAELEKVEHDNIITKVTAPTDWVNPLVVVPKKDGSLRICLDP